MRLRSSTEQNGYSTVRLQYGTVTVRYGYSTVRFCTVAKSIFLLLLSQIRAYLLMMRPIGVLSKNSMLHLRMEYSKDLCILLAALVNIQMNKKSAIKLKMP